MHWSDAQVRRRPRKADIGAIPMVIKSRITVAEIASRLSIGRLTVYKLLENQLIPSIRFGHRYIVTRRAYEAWEQSCGRSLLKQANEHYVCEEMEIP